MPGFDAVDISPEKFYSSSWFRRLKRDHVDFWWSRGAVVGSEAVVRSSCEGSGSLGEHVSGVVEAAGDGPVEVSRGLRKTDGGALARGEVVEDIGDDDGVVVVAMSGADGDTSEGDDVVGPGSTSTGSARRVSGVE